MESGADFLGFVLEPSSPRYVPAESEVFSQLPELSPLPCVAVFGNSLDHPQRRRFPLVQSWNDPMVLDAQAWLPVVAVRQGSNVEDLLSQAGNRPALVLDPFVPGQQGGTGQQLDWDLARNFVERFSGRVILAGGLSPENVAEAVRFVRPWAVDASSRLETSPGKKDLNLVESFIREAKKKS